MVRQPSTDGPGRLEARLRNVSREPVRVGFGPTLLFTDNANDDLEWPRDLVLDPESPGVLTPEPWKAKDGCWRFPEDGTIAIQSSLDFRKIGPDEAISETYDVYTRGDSLPCLPAGQYRFQDEEYIESESRPVVLTLEVRADENHRLSVDAKLSANRSD